MESFGLSGRFGCSGYVLGILLANLIWTQASGVISGGDLRLTNITRNTEDIRSGFVEVHYDGAWHVLDAWLWLFGDANVTCKEMGFKYAIANDSFHVNKNDSFSWLLLLGGFNCNGTEDKLTECGIGHRDPSPIIQNYSENNQIAVASCYKDLAGSYQVVYAAVATGIVCVILVAMGGLWFYKRKNGISINCRRCTQEDGLRLIS